MVEQRLSLLHGFEAAFFENTVDPRIVAVPVEQRRQIEAGHLIGDRVVAPSLFGQGNEERTGRCLDLDRGGAAREGPLIGLGTDGAFGADDTDTLGAGGDGGE